MLVNVRRWLVLLGALSSACAGSESPALSGVDARGGDPDSAEDGAAPPGSDASDASEAPFARYRAQLLEPSWVVPGAAVVDGVSIQAANNNVSIALHDGRLYMAWRTAQYHFAAADVAMHVVSSPDLGRTFVHEVSYALGSDVREPLLFSFGGTLHLSFFQGGTDALAFEPHGMWRTTRRGPGDWAPLEAWGVTGEVPWEVQVHDGTAFLTTYLGSHYELGHEGQIAVRFFQSADGAHWTPVSGGDPAVYRGGVSETAFVFDTDGSLWAVMRNEDGDASGFGSLVCRAPAGDLATWDCPATSDPERYDSPRMFRYGDDIYLVARRDIGGPFDQGRTERAFADRQLKYLIDYSARPKRTALYRIDRTSRAVIHVVDLPSAGDTAFPSIARMGPHTFRVANYTSPPEHGDWTWIEGQTSPEGTQLYLLDIEMQSR